MRWITGFFDAIRARGEALQDWLLLFVRLFWGIQFVFAGLGKWNDISGTARFLTSLGIPFAEINSYLLAGTELFGGALLVVGLLSRLASIPLIIAMIVAYFTAHIDSLKEILSHPTAFTKEEPFNFLMMALMVFSFGPGRFSLDNYIFSKK